MNPIIRKELHLHMRMRRCWWLLGLYLFALCGMVTLVYYNSAMNAGRGNPVGAVVGTAAVAGHHSHRARHVHQPANPPASSDRWSPGARGHQHGSPLAEAVPHSHIQRVQGDDGR